MGRINVRIGRGRARFRRRGPVFVHHGGYYSGQTSASHRGLPDEQAHCNPFSPRPSLDAGGGGGDGDPSALFCVCCSCGSIETQRHALEKVLTPGACVLA